MRSVSITKESEKIDFIIIAYPRDFRFCTFPVLASHRSLEGSACLTGGALAIRVLSSTWCSVQILGRKLRVTTMKNFSFLNNLSSYNCSYSQISLFSIILITWVHKDRSNAPKSYFSKFKCQSTSMKLPWEKANFSPRENNQINSCLQPSIKRQRKLYLALFYVLN